MTMKRGLFLTLEGVDGAGKSTHVQWIVDRLADLGQPVLCTREPGGTAIGEQLRTLLLHEAMTLECETLLMFAARAEHVRTVIEPALAAGTWVVCDRFTDATYAYQGGGRNMDMQTIAWLEQMVQGDLRPDLTLLLDAPIELGMQRAQKRGALDRFEVEQIDFFKRVQQTYLQRAAEHPNRYQIIDASLPLEQVQAQISAVLERLIAQ
jgi:dTMP kinase